MEHLEWLGWRRHVLLALAIFPLEFLQALRPMLVELKEDVVGHVASLSWHVDSLLW